MPKLTLIAISIVTIINADIGIRSVQAQETIQAEKICQVTDPTGTPLNVRLQPNGKIINQIRNGKNVSIQSFSSDNRGKPWVLVAIKNQGNYKILGYVLREFVSCY